MAFTYRKIASVTVGSGGAASIDFTSIPGTYTDLQIYLSSRLASSTEVNLRFNSATTNLSDRVFYGIIGVGVGSNASTTIRITTCGSGDTADTFGSAIIYIPNYTSSTNKSVMADSNTENNSTAAALYMTAAIWSNSNAITSVNLVPSSGNFVQHSTAVLYGILQA
jgi:hypothetical protein